MAGTITPNQPPITVDVRSEDSEIQAQQPSKEISAEVVSRSVKTALLIAGLLALSATAVSMMLLGAVLGMLGSFVAFSLMLFIGTPLMLASINDVVEGH